MKITIIVADGRVESVFIPAKSNADIQVCDFDTFDLTEADELAEYVDELRGNKNLKEVIC